MGQGLLQKVRPAGATQPQGEWSLEKVMGLPQHPQKSQSGNPLGESQPQEVCGCCRRWATARVFKGVHSTLGAHRGGGERGLNEGQLCGWSLAGHLSII